MRVSSGPRNTSSSLPGGSAIVISGAPHHRYGGPAASSVADVGDLGKHLGEGGIGADLVERRAQAERRRQRHGPDERATASVVHGQRGGGGEQGGERIAVRWGRADDEGEEVEAPCGGEVRGQPSGLVGRQGHQVVEADRSGLVPAGAEHVGGRQRAVEVGVAELRCVVVRRSAVSVASSIRPSHREEPALGREIRARRITGGGSRL